MHDIQYTYHIYTYIYIYNYIHILCHMYVYMYIHITCNGTPLDTATNPPWLADGSFINHWLIDCGARLARTGTPIFLDGVLAIYNGTMENQGRSFIAIGFSIVLKYLP